MFKSVTIKKNVIDNQAITNNYISDSISVKRNLINVIHFIWTGSLNGNLQIQISIDNQNWETITESTTALNGVDGSGVVEVVTACPYIRAIYNHTSGNGSLKAHYAGTTRN